MIKKRTKKNNSANTSSFSVWTSYTDLMANAFMILTLLLLLILASKPIICPTCPPPPPPNIEFSDAQGYTFEVGKATLGTQLKNYIAYGFNDQGKPLLLTQITTNLENYPQGDIVEVIGHTDEQQVDIGNVINCSQNINTSLDRSVTNFIGKANELNLSKICYMSNFDLGYMRALAVAKEIELQIAQQTPSEIANVKAAIKNIKLEENDGNPKKREDLQKKLKTLEKLPSLKFRAYSAGPMINPKFNPNDQEGIKQKKRRRIEIRFTESQS